MPNHDQDHSRSARRKVLQKDRSRKAQLTSDSTCTFPTIAKKECNLNNVTSTPQRTEAPFGVRASSEYRHKLDSRHAISHLPHSVPKPFMCVRAPSTQAQKQRSLHTNARITCLRRKRVNNLYGCIFPLEDQEEFKTRSITPAPQCTRVAFLRACALSMKSKHLLKCFLIASVSVSSCAMRRCWMPYAAVCEHDVTERIKVLV